VPAAALGLTLNTLLTSRAVVLPLPPSLVCPPGAPAGGCRAVSRQPLGRGAAGGGQ
jgi:hypothetical protein